MKTFYLIAVILISALFNNQLRAKTTNMLLPAGLEYRIFVFTFPEKESESVRSVFEKLRNESKNIVYVDLLGNELTVVCALNVNSQHLIEHAEKQHLHISLRSEALKSKKELSETLKSNLTSVRSISRASFEGLPLVKQEHILSHPERYVIKE